MMSDDTKTFAAQLDRYLGALPPRAQAKLMYELERAELAGTGDATQRIILDRLRHVVREEHEQARRLGSPQRLFCEPLEPFLVDEAGSGKHRGWVQRASLNAVWRWLGRQQGLEGLAGQESRATDALLKGDYEAAAAVMAELRRMALPVIQAALETSNSGTREARRLTSELESERAVADLADIAAILRLEAPLSALAAKLPATIERLSPDHAQRIVARSGIGEADLVYPLMLIYSRLANRPELLHLLVADAGTDDAARLTGHRLSACVDIVFADLDFAIERIERHITNPAEFEALVSAIRRFHSLASGMGVTLDLDGAEKWRARLAEKRRRASEILGREVARTPGAIRRALKPRRRDAGLNGPDPADVADAQHAARLMVALRPYRSETAVNEILAGTARQVEAFIEAANTGIVQDLRDAEEADRNAARATFEAALAINEIVFGEAYTALLRRSGRLADPPPEEEEDEDDLPLPAA